MNFKLIAILGGTGIVGVTIYNKFKTFIKTIKVYSYNYEKLLDSFKLDINLLGKCKCIIPYKIAKIELLNENNEVFAISKQPPTINTGEFNQEFVVVNPQLLNEVSNVENYIATLKVKVNFNYVLFKVSENYTQEDKINSNDYLTKQPLLTLNNSSNKQPTIAINNISSKQQIFTESNYNQKKCKCTNV